MKQYRKKQRSHNSDTEISSWGETWPVIGHWPHKGKQYGPWTILVTLRPPLASGATDSGSVVPGWSRCLQGETYGEGPSCPHRPFPGSALKGSVSHPVLWISPEVKPVPGLEPRACCFHPVFPTCHGSVVHSASLPAHWALVWYLDGEHWCLGHALLHNSPVGFLQFQPPHVCSLPFPAYSTPSF